MKNVYECAEIQYSDYNIESSFEGVADTKLRLWTVDLVSKPICLV